jgi:hypothetical protein
MFQSVIYISYLFKPFVLSYWKNLRDHILLHTHMNLYKSKLFNMTIIYNSRVYA